MGWSEYQVGSNISTKKFVEYQFGRFYGDLGKIVKIVYLTERKNGQILIKKIDESEGPCYYEASVRFINLLSKPSNYESAWWRNRCLERSIA